MTRVVADMIRQCVDRGLADEISIHLSPILLGSGTPLFLGGGQRQLVQRSARVSPVATHLVYGLAEG
jgi:riboflavin biosynthesis pyrimidine reductase